MPGDGMPPPYLAGREDELKEFDSFTVDLRNGGAASASAAMLYGPRGNGKTVLMGVFLERLREKTDDAKPGIRTLRLSAARIPNVRTLHKYVWGGWNSPRVKGVSVEISKLGVRLDFDSGDGGFKSLADVLRRRIRASGPLVIAIDEAHTLDSDLGKALFNVVQDMRSEENQPILLLLAGTPGIAKHLDTMGATFWGRAKKIPAGLLDDEGSREALTKPFQEASVEFEEAALSRVVEESQGYPYFLQLWGQALGGTLDGDANRIEMAHVEKAHKSVSRQQGIYYSERYNELPRAELLKPAQVIAESFRGRNSLSVGSVMNLIAEELQEERHVQTTLDGLVALGYIWDDGQGYYIPGIPSLMTYCLEHGREPPAPSNELNEPDGHSLSI